MTERLADCMRRNDPALVEQIHPEAKAERADLLRGLLVGPEDGEPARRLNDALFERLHSRGDGFALRRRTAPDGGPGPTLPPTGSGADALLLELAAKTQSTSPHPTREGVFRSLRKVAEAEFLPREVAAERRDDPVFPAVLTMTAPERGRRKSLPLLGLLPDSGPRQLPMFGGEFQAAAFPVGMYRTAGGGAPLALRLLLRAVLDTPLAERAGPVYMPRTPWRDVVRELLPRGCHVRNQWPGLLRGLESLNADPRFLVPILTGAGGYVGRRVALATEQPLTGHVSEWVRFLVHLPDGSDRGPIADRRTWFLAAAHSTARFALATGLAVLWDRPGATRVKPASRAPFVQSADFDRYKVLTRRELASLTGRTAGRSGTAGTDGNAPRRKPSSTCAP